MRTGPSFTILVKLPRPFETHKTNTKSEKAAFIQAAFAGFSALLGDLHEESYIYVQDVRAASYGYGGRTQDWGGTSAPVRRAARRR
ncbi:hypothetical protein [Rhizobium sp. NFR12]|uniref:tautomerase family protein n=1 Tax=Rhizobium sp. NFR12 TaxID=1566261 RepID=UPI001AEC77E5|nr:hypothetical protein [Rhizobium sp. NFR12]